MNEVEIKSYEQKIVELERLRAVYEMELKRNEELKAENLSLKNQVENQKRELEKCLKTETVM